jgi:hypothetical protein
MSKIKEEPKDYNENEINVRCRQCQVQITSQNEPLPRINYKETEILNLKQQVQNLKGDNDRLKQELHAKDVLL